eukprot:1797459-Rhodomonas_salina.3
MTAQIHYSSLLTNPGALQLAEDVGDPVWTQMKASDFRWGRSVSALKFGPDEESDFVDESVCEQLRGIPESVLELQREMFFLSLPRHYRVIKPKHGDFYCLLLPV